MSENGRYSTIDQRQLQRFMRMPDFVRAQTPSQLAQHEFTLQSARWTPEVRIVYRALQDGYTSMDSLPVATGLSESQIEGALNFLVSEGSIPRAGYDEGVEII